MINSRKISITLLIIVFASCLLLLKSCIDYMLGKPNPPEIEYGEFPFKITYKLDGEVYTVEGVYICEYKGIDWDEGYGFYNKWDGYIKDTGDEDLFIAEQDGVKLRCLLGDYHYYMGLWNNTKPYEPFLFCEDNPIGDLKIITAREEYLEKFDIELLEWELSEPLIKKGDI